MGAAAQRAGSSLGESRASEQHMALQHVKASPTAAPALQGCRLGCLPGCHTRCLPRGCQEWRRHEAVAATPRPTQTALPASGSQHRSCSVLHARFTCPFLITRMQMQLCSRVLNVGEASGHSFECDTADKDEFCTLLHQDILQRNARQTGMAGPQCGW